MIKRPNLQKKPGKTALLIVVILLIVGAIILIEGLKPHGSNSTIYINNNNTRVAQKELTYEHAKELVSPDGYINTGGMPITIQENIGKKVILLDFWTYTCINCQRTQPYLNAWQEKYADDGLLIIGVHTPEFKFEKEYVNVQGAVDEEKIKYPIVLDNNYLTWNAYQNRYWPRKYLIDIDGFIVYDHVGEGGYEETEQAIRTALAERKQVLNEKTSLDSGMAEVKVNETDFSKIRTPELYFGYDFYRNQLGNKEGIQKEKEVNYTVPNEVAANKFYLNGIWKNNPDNMEAKSSANIILVYSANKVNIVAGADQPTRIRVYVDGLLEKELEIKDFDLYNIVSREEYGEHVVEIAAEPGFKIYTFTFG
jgi:thiol-disulfide isomerase/thioredoxin